MHKRNEEVETGAEKRSETNIDELLRKAMAEAYSIESKPETVKAETIGTIENQGRIYVLFEDMNGAYWYETRFWESDGTIISEYERVFGKKKKRYRR